MNSNVRTAIIWVVIMCMAVILWTVIPRGKGKPTQTLTFTEFCSLRIPAASRASMPMLFAQLNRDAITGTFTDSSGATLVANDAGLGTGGLPFLEIACGSAEPRQATFSRTIFTPDGTAIVFPFTLGETCFLSKADIATGANHRVTKASSGCESDPAFSPDRKALAYMRAPRRGARAALMVAKPDGTGARTLVSAKKIIWNRCLFHTPSRSSFCAPALLNTTHPRLGAGVINLICSLPTSPQAL